MSKAKELVKMFESDIARVKAANEALEAAHEKFRDLPECADETQEYLENMVAYGVICDALMERDDAEATLALKVEEAYAYIPRRFKSSFAKSVDAFYREAGLE